MVGRDCVVSLEARVRMCHCGPVKALCARIQRYYEELNPFHSTSASKADDVRSAVRRLEGKEGGKCNGRVDALPTLVLTPGVVFTAHVTLGDGLL